MPKQCIARKSRIMVMLLAPILLVATASAQPINDDCVNRFAVSDGVTSFDNIFATTDGPLHVLCDFFGDLDVQSDVWFNYIATSDGNTTFSLCGSAYDTKMAVYDGCLCPVDDFRLLDCNDDFCVVQSEITTPTIAGNCYKIRIGGFNGDQGVGTLTITPPVGGQPTLLNTEVTQLSWLAPDETFALRYSDYGQLHLTVLEPAPDAIFWVNVLVDGLWVIQNQPLIEIDGEGGIQRYTYDFPLTLPPLIPPIVLQAEVLVNITPNQYPDELSFVGLPAFLVVSEHLYSPGNGLGFPITSPVLHVPPPAQLVANPATPITWQKTRRRKVPGIAEQKNHCTPGAFARSLAWMNDFYCLMLPVGNNTVQQIYDKLKNADHMMTNKAAGTRWWAKNGAALNCQDATWGKMHAGVTKFLADKNLAGKIKVQCNLFKSQDAVNPAFTPCDIFEALQAGKDVIVNWSWWTNNATTNNNNRRGGHSITVVGATKCGTMVQILYRDDVNGLDNQNNAAQTGDNNADSGVKVAKFTPGGATGWEIKGNRWEGFITLCPTPRTMYEALLKRTAESNLKVQEVQGDIAGGIAPNPQTLQEIQSIAKDIEDLVCALVKATQNLDPPCPGLNTLALRLKQKAATLQLLSEFLREDPNLNTINSMLTLINDMLAQLAQFETLLAAWELAPCPADINNDGVVGVTDLLFLFGNWGPVPPGDPAADLNNDGIVGVTDLLQLFGSWGPCP